MSQNPDRGEVWLVDLGYVAKTGPCLVTSLPVLAQDRALATLVPHTTSPRGSRVEVDVKVRFLRAGVFDAQSLVTVPLVRVHITIVVGGIYASASSHQEVGRPFP